ncbi:MAG: hypothetical protein GX472_01660 [Methanomicrobiales archaeon]|jgi:hypothetical protein|nr:hypothetical protein [Methanomicrobiales archaeon]
MKNHVSSLFIALLFTALFVTGCTTPTLPTADTPLPPVTGIPPAPDQSEQNPIPDKDTSSFTPPATNQSEQNPIPDKDTSSFDTIAITLHSITMQSRLQGSGREVPLALFNISLRNDGSDESVSIDNTSLILVARGSLDQVYFSPETGTLPEGSTNPLIPVTLDPGQEQRGTVVFQLIEKVHSGVLYVKYPDWTIAGELYIPEISNGSLPDADYDNQKTLGMRVHSAVQMKTIPGMNLRQEARIAIINVSITNYAGSDVTIQREQLFIQTEQSRTLEHGGDRVTKEMARQYLRFPLALQPGETKTGPVLYVIKSGTRTNKLVLMDSNCVIQSMVDLNPLYRYE